MGIWGHGRSLGALQGPVSPVYLPVLLSTESKGRNLLRQCSNQTNKIDEFWARQEATINIKCSLGEITHIYYSGFHEWEAFWNIKYPQVLLLCLMRAPEM